MRTQALKSKRAGVNVELTRQWLPEIKRYGLAALSVWIAVAASLLLGRFDFRVPAAPLLLFAVAVSTWYGGRGPSVLAVILSATSFDWYFVEPVRTIYINRSEIPYYIIFVGFAALMSWFETIRRRADEVLREQASLLNLTHDSVFVMDMEGVIRYWNRGAEERYGWTAEQALGRVVQELLKTVCPARLEQIKAEVKRTGRWEGELVHARKDGTQVIVASRWALQRDKKGAPVAILETNNDITERKRAEQALHRLNRELRAISDCNQTLLRARDERSLLDAICRIACDEAGYRMAWVGFAEHDAVRTVRPAAWAGGEEEFFATINVSWSEETERGRGPTGTAIRTGRTCYAQDIGTDHRSGFLRDAALERSYCSGIALPLKDEHGGTFGALTIYSSEPNAFTAEEVHLLEELAGDLAFGIVALRTRIERQRAEESLALRSFALNNAREAVFLLDEQARVLDVNEESCRSLGYTREELLGMRVADIDPDFPPERWPDQWRRVQDQRSTSFESHHRTKDGRIFPVEISAVYLEYGGRAFNLAVARDITERKEAEAALRESELRIRTFVDHAGDSLFVMDFETGTIVDVNRQACECLGYTREELIGKTPLSIHQDSDRGQMESVAERAAAGETVFDRHWHRRKDGSTFPVEVNTSGFRHGGRRFLLKVARDISDRVRAEEQRDKLRQLEAELAHIDRVSMLGELTTSIAHEINQPLAGVVSNGSACLRLLAQDPPDVKEVLEALGDIIRDGKRAGEVIARIRGMARKTTAAREKLDLNEIIREVLVLAKDEAIRNRVMVQTQLADDLSAIKGDRVQLQQVLLNLVMNGMEAMRSVTERGRELLITTRSGDAGEVHVTVEDSGIGFGPDVTPRIFEPFYTTKPNGMGMGLSISRSIVQSHGGRLWATTKDSGAIFHFTVPK